MGILGWPATGDGSRRQKKLVSTPGRVFRLYGRALVSIWYRAAHCVERAKPGHLGLDGTRACSAAVDAVAGVTLQLPLQVLVCIDDSSPQSFLVGRRGEGQAFGELVGNVLDNGQCMVELSTTVRVLRAAVRGAEHLRSTPAATRALARIRTLG